MNGDPWPSEVRDFRVAVTSRARAVFAPAARELRRWMLANDPHRPRYHFTAPEGWINDPNGPIYHEGTYHLFYQYRPVFANGNESGICWGHASSTDLLHWEDWPVAMWPDRRYDVDGVYSGNTFIDDDGFPCALYTGNVAGHAEAHGVLARSTDGWLTWHKHKVMDNEQRANAASPVHWDAQVWKEGELWQQLIGGAVGEGTAQRGAAHLWTSPDLEEWTHRGTIAEDHDPDRRYWELPYLVPFGAPDGERAVLMVSARNNRYWTGSYDRQARRFHPDKREPRFVDLGLYYSSTRTWWMTVDPAVARAACCSAGCWGRGHRSTRRPTGSARTAFRGYWSWRATSCCSTRCRNSKPCAGRSTVNGTWPSCPAPRATWNRSPAMPSNWS